MSLLQLLLLLGGFGVLGGLVNALSEQDGLLRPRRENLPNGSTVLRVGFFGNLFVGAVAAIVVAVLYSPLAQVAIGGSDPPSFSVTLGTLVGALLSGVGGARVLTAEANRRIDKASKDQLADTITVLAQKVDQLQAAANPPVP